MNPPLPKEARDLLRGFVLDLMRRGMLEADQTKEILAMLGLGEMPGVRKPR